MAAQESCTATPDWLSKSFMEKALRNGFEREKLKVLGMKVGAVAAPGDQYGSQMFRCYLTVKDDGDEGQENTESVSVVVKAIPDGVMGEALKSSLAFEREAEVLSKTMPAFSNILTKANPQEERLAARCYYYENHPKEIIVMEDLKVDNFRIGSRQEGLDMNHASLVLRALGKFHAASLVLDKEKPKALEIFKNSFWEETSTDLLKQMFEIPLSVLAKDLLTWPNFEEREHYSRKFSNLSQVTVEKILNLMKVNNSKLNVLIHGDSWVNNFMFRYDSSGNPTQVKFVDFQMSLFNSPALDLQHFIFSSTNPGIRFDRVDTFLRIYYNSFEETLKKLNFHQEKPFGFDQLKKEFEEKYFWGLLVSCTFFPHLLMPSSETLDADEFFKGDEKKLKKIYQGEDIKRILKKGFLFFEERGIL